MIIKAKIIGTQIWTAKNLSKAEYQSISGSSVPEKNDSWQDYTGPKCFGYKTNLQRGKEYLFDIGSLIRLRESSPNWRIPNTQDLDLLFRTVDCNSRYGWVTSLLGRNLKGTYGWINNGNNPIGFNGYPNPSKEGSNITERDGSKWWYFNETTSSYEGFGILENDVVAISGPYGEDAGLAIRLVMDYTEPRIEHGIQYL